MKKIILAIVGVLIATSAWATYNLATFDGLTGGGAALDGRATANLTDGAIAVGEYNGETYFFRYDTTSTDSESTTAGSEVIIPNDNATGTGAWIVMYHYPPLCTTSTAGLMSAAQATALAAIDTEAELEALLELADLQGDLADSQLSANVPLLDGTHTISGTWTFSNGVNVSPTATPMFEFKDSDLLGADEYTASIEINATTLTDGAEVSDMIFYYMDDGTKTEAARVDGSDNQFEFAIPVTGTFNLDASGFDGQCATTDDTLQEIAQVVDDLVIPTVPTVTSTAEINTGTDNAKFTSADAIAGSYAGTKDVCWTIVDSDTDTPAAADGVQAYTVPPSLNGMNLVDVIASVHTKGVTGTIDIQVRKRSGGVDSDMLSTKITLGDEFYASDETIDTDEDDIATGDQIYIDVDAIHSGTAAKGLSVTCLFRLP